MSRIKKRRRGGCQMCRRRSDHMCIWQLLETYYLYSAHGHVKSNTWQPSTKNRKSDVTKSDTRRLSLRCCYFYGAGPILACLQITGSQNAYIFTPRSMDRFCRRTHVTLYEKWQYITKGYARMNGTHETLIFIVPS